jgi:hypothetical protein
VRYEVENKLHDYHSWAINRAEEYLIEALLINDNIVTNRRKCINDKRKESASFLTSPDVGYGVTKCLDMMHKADTDLSIDRKHFVTLLDRFVLKAYERHSK